MVIPADGYSFHLSGGGTRLTLSSLRSEEWEVFLKRRAKGVSQEPRGGDILLFVVSLGSLTSHLALECRSYTGNVTLHCRK